MANLKRNRPKQRVINISAEAHQAFKDYCDREGLRMSPTATKIILKAIEKKSSESEVTGR
jgi:hypothetical protein